jgi:predicted metal-binding protein
MLKKAAALTGLLFAAILIWQAGVGHSTGRQPADNATGFPAAPAPHAQQPAERTMFMPLADAFGDLERPPVRFNHDKHTRALEPQGCETCHPKGSSNRFDFTFPKGWDAKADDRQGLMNLVHDSCVGCHTQRIAEKQKAGPETCGECHIIETGYRAREYAPILPEYYEPLRDTYHAECIACHREPAKTAQDAGDLDWKSFYVKEQHRAAEAWPEVLFDYFLHDTHARALEKKCELCHYLAPEIKSQRAAEGKEPSCRDWLRDVPDDHDYTDNNTAHRHCINCHLERRQEHKKAGPVYCSQCHREPARSAAEMQAVPRQECDQKERFLIQLEKDARMKGAAFDHKAHHGRTRACQDCHHDTLRPCRDCHTLQGGKEGGGITLAEAFHESGSTWSCIGCHEAEKKKPGCAGCHHLLTGGLVESACAACHSGDLASLDRSRKTPPLRDLMPDNAKDEWEIGFLEHEYKPSKFKHRDMVNRLIEASDNSTLARYFHASDMTVCAGCHHVAPLQKKASVPQCRTCHTVRKEPKKSTPTLLGAYHQQCLGCHEKMGGDEKKRPRKCAGCHEEKTAQDRARQQEQ